MRHSLLVGHKSRRPNVVDVSLCLGMTHSEPDHKQTGVILVGTVSLDMSAHENERNDFILRLFVGQEDVSHQTLWP